MESVVTMLHCQLIFIYHVSNNSMGNIISNTAFLWEKQFYNILQIHLSRCTWLLGIIRFDAAHVRWLFRHEDLHKFHQAVFELSGSLKDRYKNIHKPQKYFWFQTTPKQLKGRREREREGGREFPPSLGVSGLSLPLCGSSASGSRCLTGTWPAQRPNHRTTCQRSIFLFTEQWQKTDFGEALPRFFILSHLF